MISQANPASFVMEFTRSRKEIVQHEITDAVNVEEEITLQVTATNLESNISSTDTPSSSMGDNEDIDYITSIAVESANICSIEPSHNSHFPKEIYTEMLIEDKPIKFQRNRL